MGLPSFFTGKVQSGIFLFLMKAIIQTGGKQYLVEAGQTLEVELLNSAKDKAEFAPLLVIDGDKTQIGKPTVEGVKVKADIVAETKGDKVKILRYKSKKRVKKLTGHRQKYSQIKITSISK